MLILNRGKCTYYIKEESIVLHYNLQYTSFNVYQLQNRKRFKDFKATLIDSSPDEYTTINDALGLASKFGLVGMVGRKPTINSTDIDISEHYRLKPILEFKK